MKKTCHAFAAAFLALLAVQTPAYAGKNEDAWASCLWAQVPTTANNWLNMVPTKDGWARLQTPPDYAIEWRLQAACFDILKPANKKWPPSFYGKKLRVAMLATKPLSIGPDIVDPTGFRCDLYFEDDLELKNRAGFDWGIEAKSGDVIFQTTRYGFAGTGNATVQLANGAGIRKCFRVLADGSLTDA